MKVQLEIEFAPESVANLIITAVESHGGWLESFNATGLPRPDGVTWWEHLPKVLGTKYDWFLSFEDIDGDKHVLNQDSVERGLRLLITEEPSHYSDWQSENDDAITADVFLQLCLLGEVVFDMERTDLTVSAKDLDLDALKQLAGRSNLTVKDYVKRYSEIYPIK